MKIRNHFGIAASIITLALGGCTSGGGPDTLGGVAAVGAPIVGGTVNVSCATGSPLTTSTSVSGAWQVTLAGQGLPCAIQVAGGTINSVANITPYHSVATAPGTVNITPLTDLLVANLTGTSNPTTWFDGLGSTPAGLAAVSQANVAAALGKLRDALGLAALSTVNPVTTPFTAAPGNFIDDLLEALKTALADASITYASLLNDAALPDFTSPIGLVDALQAACTATTSGCVASSGGAGGNGGGSGTLPVGVSGQVVTMEYASAQPNSPYANGDRVLFTFSSSGTLTLTEQYTVVASSFTVRGNQYIWTDSAHSREYALSVLNGAIHEVNVTGLNGSPFYGQFSPVSGGTPVGGGGGNFTLTVTVTASGIAAPPVTINNVPKPANQNEFCGDVNVQGALDAAASGGTLTINSCTFNGTTGSISATLNITTPISMSVPYVVSYTYSGGS